MHKEVDLDDEYQPATWMVELLRAFPQSNFSYEGQRDGVSDLFLERCDEAARMALSVSRLRLERQRIGFVPMSFEHYIEGLVKLADVSIAPMLEWFGVKNLSPLNAESTAGISRLAREIGIGSRELLAFVRIGFAGQFNHAPIALLVARRRSAGSGLSELDECEYALEQIEADYDPANLRELREIESRISATFAADGN